MTSTASNAKEEQAWQERVPTGLATPVLTGLLFIAIFVAGFGVWAVTAPLDGAVVAPGVVVASGENQSVQHLEGGIISTINVRQGDAVKAGDPLLVLDETRIEVDRNRVNSSLISLEAQRALASAERSDLEQLAFSTELVEAAEKAGLQAVLEEQKAEFRFRLEQHKSEIDTINQQKKALQEEITGLEEQLSAEDRKRIVLKEDLLAKKKLLDKGLTSRDQYNALLRAEADSDGRIGALKSSIGQQKTAIAKTEQQQNTLSVKRRSDASNVYNQLSNKIDDLKEQLVAREDVLSRSVIRAPTDGIIVDMAKNTIGSIIRPGETILNILPTADELVFDVRVSPTDKDSVHVGQEAHLRFSALNTRTTPDVPAKIEYVSADRLVDQVTRESYFQARLKMTRDLPGEIDPENIYAGMPVEAFINTGERTFLEYLVRPIQDSFSKAFRED